MTHGPPLDKSELYNYTGINNGSTTTVGGQDNFGTAAGPVSGLALGLTTT